MRKETLLFVVASLGACVPTTTGTGIGEATGGDGIEAADEAVEAGESETGESETGESETGESETGESETGETEADEEFAEAIFTLVYGKAGPGKLVIEAHAKDASSIAKITFVIEEKAFNPILMISADFADMHAKWTLDDGELTSIGSPKDAPIISARAQVIVDAITIDGQSELASCAARIAATVAGCAGVSGPQTCIDAFALTYCQCRYWLNEIANIACD
jgi:hypothetical protein